VDDFEGRIEVEVRQQMRVGKKGKKKVKREKYRRMKLLGKYTAKCCTGGMIENSRMNI